MISLVKLLEILFEIFFGLYFMLIFSTVFAEKEENIILSLAQPIITSYYILKNIYVY